MDFRDDGRAQSIQIGAVLLFGLLIVALSSYQAFAVPDQNERIEYEHNLEVQRQFESVRNVIVAAPGQETPRSVELRLGTEYPRRVFGVNPGPATGTVRTQWSTDSDVTVRIDGARTRGEVGDFWNGAEHQYRTGQLRYEPNYNLYENAPVTVYENSIVYNRFDVRNQSVTDQRLVDGRTITLVTLNGTLQTTRAGRMTVEPTYLSRSTNTVSVTANTSGVRFRRYEDDYNYVDSDDGMPDFSESNVVDSGVTSNFAVPTDRDQDDFAYVFNGTVEVPRSGTYTFYTTSDDGSVLRVNGVEVVSNRGEHGTDTESGNVFLSEGTHDIGVSYFENGGENTLTVEWEPPGGSRQEIPDENLSNTEGLTAETIDIEVPTGLDNGTWSELLSDQFAGNGGEVESMDVRGVEPGYEYYEAEYGGVTMPDFDEDNLVATGGTDNFDIDELRQRGDDFAFRFFQEIEIPETGDYTFYTRSDDGSRLFVDGERVVNNDGIHAPQTDSGTVTLSEGTHDITVTYFENDGGEELTVEWDGPSFGREVIPDDVLSNRSGANTLELGLDGTSTYQLRMARVAVGSRLGDQEAAYVTPVSGTSENVPEGETSEVVVEVRDSYNNPVPDVLVNASTTRSDSNVDPRVDLSDDDGQVRLTYEADDDIDGEPKPDRINVSLTVDPPSRTAFDPDTAVNASIPVSIGNADGSGFGGGGGGGVAYGIEWLNPDDPGYNPDANLSSCDPDSCLWDVSTSQDATLTLPGSTNPPVQNTTLNFAVNDTSVGTVRPGDAETGPGGEAPTELRARGNGTVRSFVTGQSGSDQLDVIVTNVTRLGLVYETDATAQPYPPSVSDARSRVDLNVTNSRDQSVEVYGITINDSTTGAQIEDQNDGGSREVELDVDGDGTPEGDADPGSGFSVGTRIELDTNATLAANGDSGGEDTAHLQLNEFQEGSGTPVDMVGEEIEVTLHYTVGGQRAADTFDVKTIQEGG
jgi:hypothetical protein